MSNLEFDYIKHHVLNAKKENYDHHGFKEFWRDAWAWMKENSRKEDFELYEGHPPLIYLSGFVAEFSHEGKFESAQVRESFEPTIAGTVVEEFFDFMRTTFNVVPVWRKVRNQPPPVTRNPSPCDDR